MKPRYTPPRLPPNLPVKRARGWVFWLGLGAYCAALLCLLYAAGQMNGGVQ